MRTVSEVIRRLLPDGTGRRNSWSEVPRWPPDLFAVTATLVNRSGCYAHSHYLCGFERCHFDEKYRSRVAKLGADFAKWKRPQRIQKLWETLLSEEWELLDDGWCDAAMELLAVADQACGGVGFAAEGSAGLALFVLQAYRMWERDEGRPLPFVPHSLCLKVPPWEACVQPKTRTPQIGCTLRSLSHNLALLPPITEVKTQWDYAISSEDNSDEPFNVLLVPYPYEIRGSAFQPLFARDRQHRITGMFSLQQTWLDGVTSADVTMFIQELIREAKQEVSSVHAVILPEGALTEEMADEVAAILGKEANIELFISGVMSHRDGRAYNQTYFAVYRNGQPYGAWTQSKHHRWKLDEHQVRRYHLGHVLGKRTSWWEAVEVAGRECHFYTFRYGASLAVLICEDLARIEPVQSVVRSVGPNLVIALLMDSTQMERRWPGRYATVLADDPGSAVLTLTSMGLINRSNMPSRQGSRYIAIWKEPLGTARELELPQGCHSLLLTLSPRPELNYTADGRDDGGSTMTLSLTSVIGLKLRNELPWLHAL